MRDDNQTTPDGVGAAARAASGGAALAGAGRRRKASIREFNEAHLLACAEAVFAERGFEGANTDEVVKLILRAQIKKPRRSAWACRPLPGGGGYC